MLICSSSWLPRRKDLLRGGTGWVSILSLTSSPTPRMSYAEWHLVLGSRHPLPFAGEVFRVEVHSCDLFQPRPFLSWWRFTSRSHCGPRMFCRPSLFHLWFKLLPRFSYSAASYYVSHLAASRRTTTHNKHSVSWQSFEDLGFMCVQVHLKVLLEK